MDLMKKKGVRAATTLAALAGMFAVFAVAAPSASAAPAVMCPGTFQVKHNDRIGQLKLPAGPYTIKARGLSCQQASDNFATFLQRPDGDLPNGWRLNVSKQKFIHGDRNVAFTVQRAGSGGGGGGGGGGNSGGGGGSTTGKCPGTFRVQHNDKIGKLNLPAGNYAIKVKRMSCQDASNYFKQFLNDPDGNLPNGWKLFVQKAKFKNKKMNVAFRVNQVS